MSCPLFSSMVLIIYFIFESCAWVSRLMRATCSGPIFLQRMWTVLSRMKFRTDYSVPPRNFVKLSWNSSSEVSAVLRVRFPSGSTAGKYKTIIARSSRYLCVESMAVVPSTLNESKCLSTILFAIFAYRAGEVFFPSNRVRGPSVSPSWLMDYLHPLPSKFVSWV